MNNYQFLTQPATLNEQGAAIFNVDCRTLQQSLILPTEKWPVMSSMYNVRHPSVRALFPQLDWIDDDASRDHLVGEMHLATVELMHANPLAASTVKAVMSDLGISINSLSKWLGVNATSLRASLGQEGHTKKWVGFLLSSLYRYVHHRCLPPAAVNQFPVIKSGGALDLTDNFKAHNLSYFNTHVTECQLIMAADTTQTGYRIQCFGKELFLSLTDLMQLHIGGYLPPVLTRDQDFVSEPGVLDCLAAIAHAAFTQHSFTFDMWYQLCEEFDLSAFDYYWFGVSNARSLFTNARGNEAMCPKWLFLIMPYLTLTGSGNMVAKSANYGDE